MIKSELIELIAKRNPHLYHRDAERVVQTILDAIVESLANGGRVELRGFGAFSIRERDARKGRNPRTGKTVFVAAKRVPFFKTSKELHKNLNAPPRRNLYSHIDEEHRVET